MTNNQISYAKLKEDQRHNLATESISKYSTDVSADLALETGRHNLAQERINWYSNEISAMQQRAQEQRWVDQSRIDTYNAHTGRYNAGTARMGVEVNAENAEINRDQLDEMIRHNFEDERLRELATNLTYEANIAGLNMQERHNLAVEAIDRFKAETQAGVAATESVKNITQSFKNVTDALKSGMTAAMAMAAFG